MAENLDGTRSTCPAEIASADTHPDIVFDLNLSCNHFTILGSPVHLHKCLMNLCTNAVEAMPSGGLINIGTKVCKITALNNKNINIIPGSYVKLTISDSGIGMQPDEIKKIFDPFYTNKTMGQSGTGLGMTIVWTTIKDHNAYIDVKSEMGNGTTFSLYFPTTLKKRKEKSTFDMEMIKGHGESILIIDDIAEQREMAMQMMSALGYKTFCAKTGEEGIEHIKSHQTDLILLDMILGPGFDGLDTYRQIKKLNPKLKVIIVSGAAQSDRINQALTIGARQFVRKPYSLKTMGMSIRKEINN